MRVDVFLAPSELRPTALDGRVVAVIDVLRATTTIAAALMAGARTVIPFLEMDDALRTARQYERGEVRLAGERQMRTIPGFDLGNSPLEFSADVVGQQTVLLTTTNGTRALLAAEHGKEVYAAAFANYTATRARLLDALAAGESVSILCSGREGAFSLEDATCAGRFVRTLVASRDGVAVNDAARACVMLDAEYGDDFARLFADSDHGRALDAAGFVEDLIACGTLDLYPVLAQFTGRAVVSPALALGRIADER